MKNNHLSTIFLIGQTVRVRSDYRCKTKPHRDELAIVIAYETNSGVDALDPFIDNILKFPCGIEEPFANWEIETDGVAE